MSEASMWTRLRKALKSLDPVRVENRVGAGTPDVNTVGDIWIELKWKRKKPRYEHRIMKLDHEYSIEQRTWAVQRRRAGGKVFVIVKVSNEWILLDGGVAADHLEYVSLNMLRQKALGTWVKTLNEKELLNLLTRPI